MSIYRGRTTTTESAHVSFMGILSILLFLSWWRAFEEEIQPSGDYVDTARG